jgi:hypothetical protein
MLLIREVLLLVNVYESTMALLTGEEYESAGAWSIPV